MFLLAPLCWCLQFIYEHVSSSKSSTFPSFLWAVPCFIMLSLVEIRLCVVFLGASDFLWFWFLFSCELFFMFFRQLTVSNSCMLMCGSVSPATLPLKRSCLISQWIFSQTPCEVHFPLRAKVKVLPVPSPLCQGLRLNQVIMWKEAVICQSYWVLSGVFVYFHSSSDAWRWQNPSELFSLSAWTSCLPFTDDFSGKLEH